ncbi:MAG: glycosyltransferase [Roseiarcus sp.]
MRVLIVGNGNERYFGGRYYNTERKLTNGFVRNGHLLYFFSDRDVARQATIFRSSRAGRGEANRRFLNVARNFQPDFIVFMHSCLISTETFAKAKRLPQRPRLAQVCVDPMFRRVNVDFLKDRASVVDATFVTTAGEVLAQFSSPTNVSSYIPSAIDSSIERARAFERSDQAFDMFFAANAAGDQPGDPRRTTPALIAKSGKASIDYHGFDGRPPVFGAEYFRRLADARMALNINSDRAERASVRAPAEELYLYNSNRISQLMGCGLLTLSFRVNQLMELFEEDKEMAFADTPEEMLETALRYKRDDAARRRAAEAGWRKSHQELNERLVARYIEEVAFRRALSHPYIWPTKLW